MITEGKTCNNCAHFNDSESICILRKCKRAIAELVDAWEPKPPKEIIQCADCKHYEVDELGEQFCRSTWHIIHGEYGCGFCNDAERKEE